MQKRILELFHDAVLGISVVLWNHVDYVMHERFSTDYFQRLREGGYQSRYVTRFYRDYLFGYTPTITKYFWLKEFLYSVKDLLKGLFVKPTKLEIQRNLDFTMYLLRERGKYNKNVKKVLQICENLSKRVTE